MHACVFIGMSISKLDVPFSGDMQMTVNKLRVILINKEHDGTLRKCSVTVYFFLNRSDRCGKEK